MFGLLYSSPLILLTSSTHNLGMSGYMLSSVNLPAKLQLGGPSPDTHPAKPLLSIFQHLFSRSGNESGEKGRRVSGGTDCTLLLLVPNLWYDSTEL